MSDGSDRRVRTRTSRWGLGQVLLVGEVVWMVSVAVAGEPTGPSSKTPPRSVPWQKLFADQDWYKQGPPQELIIRGTLEAVPQPEGPTIIMRTYFYRLRQWNIYTEGKRLRLLDKYVGHEVEILGKEVKLALEGREVVEFWPGSIRRAMPHPKWPKLPTKPPSVGPSEPSPPAESPPKEPKPDDHPEGPVWLKLFADEDWYKQAEGKEQIFRDRLETVPQKPGVDFFMRASFYRLGDRSIYTGARKLEILDRLVGQEVEILGKPVDMSLEGRQVREIWPAAVRPFILPSESPSQKPEQKPTPPKKSGSNPTTQKKS